MKFMLTFSWKPDIKKRDEGIARFRKTGGQPPKDAKLLGRWTKVDFSGGFDSGFDEFGNEFDTPVEEEATPEPFIGP